MAMLAAVLRLWQCDLTPFLDDQASLLTRGVELLTTGQLPVVGGSFSIGVREPPLMTLLLAPLLWISRVPVWITACFCLADVAAAVLVYLTARELAGAFAGLAAGLLYAAAPAAIYFTRIADYYGLTPFFVALTMFALVRAWQRRSAAALALALVSAAVAVQLHPISAMLLPVWLVVAALLAPKLSSWRPFVPALAVIALTLAPYVYLQAHSGWVDAAALAAFLRAPRTADWATPAQALTMLAGGTYGQLLTPASQPPPGLVAPPSGWLVLALVGLGLAWALARGKASGRIVAALLLLPVLAGIRHTASVLPYYLLPILPPALVLSGVGLAALHARVAGLRSPRGRAAAELSARLHPAGPGSPLNPTGGLAALGAGARVARLPAGVGLLGRLLPAGLLAVVAGWQGVAYVTFQRTVAARGPETAYGMPLRYERQAAALLAGPAGGRVFVAQDGNQSASFPYLTGFRYQVSHSDARYGIPLPAPNGSGAEYVVQAGGPPYAFLQATFGSPAAVVRTASGTPAFGLFRLPADARQRVEAGLTPAQASFAGGLEVRGYTLPSLAAGQPSTVAIEWSVPQGQAALPAEVQQFAHLVDADGTTWSTDADERAYPRREWHSGDAVLSWFTLAPKRQAPTGGYWLETGFYAYPTGAPLRLASGGASLRIGPLRLQGTAAEQAPVGKPLAVFGDGELALLGVDRQGLDVTLHWQALKPPAGDYTVFVHLLDASGNLVAQHDGLPQGGSFPTTLWQPGDIVADTHHLAGSPEGATLEIGLYRRPSLQRLPAAASDGAPLGDAVHLPAPQ